MIIAKRAFRIALAAALMAPGGPAWAEEVSLNDLLRTLRAEPQSLAIRPDGAEMPHRMQIITRLMEHPTSALRTSRKTAETLLRSRQPSDTLSLMAEHAEFSLRDELLPPASGEFPGVPDELRPLAIRLARAAAKVKKRTKNALSGLTEPQREEVLRSLRAQLTREMPDPARLNEGETWLERDIQLLKWADSAGLAEMLSASGALVRVIESGLEKVPAKVNGPDKLTELEFEGVRVIVGTPGSDLYDKSAEVILDPGGDDVYLAPALDSKPGGTAVVLDLGGDDRYLSGEFGGAGAGVLGVGILVDRSGADSYIGQDAAQGAGLLGFGLLWDLAGNDAYQARSFAQGAAAFGIGMLLDSAGTDLYRASYFGQGAGYVRGGGLLRDREGNDVYSSGFTEPEPRGYLERYGQFSQGEVFQSLSQGYGMGWEETAGGGLGLLLDARGNDQYLADYFGQGCGRWLGWGMLYDGMGNDTYVSRRYAQGMGMNRGAGTLLDAGGNDHYQTWAVSQGAAHDQAVGMLWDGAGDDVYVGDWSMMGLSNASGVGIFRDQSGSDRYAFKMESGGISYWDGRRYRAGIGLFLDSGGQENSFAVTQTTQAWSASPWGASFAGTDSPVPGLTAESAQEDIIWSERYRAQAELEGRFLEARLERAEKLGRRTHVSELLAVASGWGVNTKVPLRAKRALFARDPEKTAAVLLELLVPRNHFARMNLEEYFLSVPGVLPFLIQRAKGEAGPADAFWRARAIDYLAKMRSSEALPVFIERLKDSSWQVRAAVARGLGYLNDEDFRKRLTSVRQQIRAKDEKVVAKTLEKWRKYETLWLLSLCPRMRRDDWARLADGLVEEPTKAVTATWAAAFLVRDAKDVDRGLSRFLLLPRLGMDALRGAAKDSHPEVRRWAVRSMSLALEKAEVLAQSLGDADFAVRELAATVLSQRGEAAIFPLTDLLNKAGPKGRAVAIKALAGIREKRLKRTFLKRLSDPDSGCRLAALQSLASGERTGLWKVETATLKPLTKDPDLWVRSLALRLLTGR